jgi:hypothetical protein
VTHPDSWLANEPAGTLAGHQRFELPSDVATTPDSAHVVVVEAARWAEAWAYRCVELFLAADLGPVGDVVEQLLGDGELDAVLVDVHAALSLASDTAYNQPGVSIVSRSP